MMKRIWIWSLIVVCLLIVSIILDYYGIRIFFFRIRLSHIIIVAEVLIILFYPKDQMFMFKMKFLAPLPNNNLSLGGERFQNYVLIENAKFSQMFYSLSYDLDSLCFAIYQDDCEDWGVQFRDKIKKFNKGNLDCLVDNTTFVLIKNGNKYLVLYVTAGKGMLFFNDRNFGDVYSWRAHYHHRLIVPKLD